ncbi:MAG: sodium-dependent transporter [Firmicutes bacterium]|nr:sodium-dependent transporter [Bacillota bacterium]
MSESKGQFNSNFGFIMASVGSAVGLGNLWGFPYKMGSNGGFAFLILYLLMLCMVGFTIMLGEFAVGRSTGKAPIEAFRELNSKFVIVGFMAFLAGFGIMAFYMTLGAYAMKYFSANFAAIFNHGGIFAATDTGAYFTDFVGNGGQVVLFMAIFCVLNMLIVMGGVSGGIERFTTIAMPALFIMLIIVIIRVLTLDGAGGGLEFMFKPNMEVFKGSGWVGVLGTAGGQMFFSLSLGMGAIITYGSYLSKKESLVKNAFIVPIADTCVALMAGLAVMPACFAFNLEPAGGPGLMFVTLQQVFNDMGSAGPIFGFIFYFLVFIAAITSSISVIESSASSIIDSRIRKGKSYSRKAIVALVTGIVFCLNLPTSLDALGAGGLPQPLGFCWLDFYDLLAEGILMPLGSLILGIFVGYVMKMDWLKNECEAEGQKFSLAGFWAATFKVTAPIGMVFILLGQIDGFFGLGWFS